MKKSTPRRLEVAPDDIIETRLSASVTDPVFVVIHFLMSKIGEHSEGSSLCSEAHQCAGGTFFTFFKRNFGAKKGVSHVQPDRKLDQS